ncbi:MAG: hypothetical protein CMI79_00525 [Candidatus Pelagibacter sp.]|nr:hypothetical protein [Candidatus Pelagibacter sp.]|tara:strand:+ start:5289 stop:6155 length:867 start_codon:yes stop_codon:yes gene_type:complete
MPELPEVEVVRRSLDNFIAGLKINKVRIFNRNLRYKISRNFKKVVQGQKITSILRKGKFLLIRLKNKKIIIIHLGMTGKIFIKTKKNSLAFVTSFYYERKFIKKHNHLMLNLSNSVDLIYNDVRKFGFIKVKNFQELNLDKHISKLGPEPLSKKFNLKYLIGKCNKSKKNIKNFLMDQKYISGLGNIYANEILFSCSINPRKLSHNLSVEQLSKIINNTKKILKVSIQLGGSSIRDFNSATGQKGLFQENFKVYDRGNKSCLKRKCGGSVKKIYISNRSTFFCTKCQK